MDEYQDQDSTDETDTEESPVLTEIRNRNRALEKENAKLMALQAEVEVAAQTQRAETAKEIVNTLGLPGLTEDVLQWVQGDITQEAVIGVLQSRGIPMPEGTESQKPEESQAPSASSVGQIVADSAAGVDKRSVEERLNAADSQAEVEAIMEEEGLVRDHL